jgi:ABC-type phosphate/phosphonate transport system substrate-binding protein
LFPTLLLKEAGLAPSDYKTQFAGSHEAVAKAVFDGAAAVGACFEDCRSMVWPDPMEREEKTTILAFTREIPADPILVRRDLPAAVKSALRRALKAASGDSDLLKRLSTNQTPITAFVPTTAEAYAMLERAAALVKAPPPAPAPKTKTSAAKPAVR